VTIPAEAIDGTFRPLPRPSVASVELDGEGVLFDEETGHSHLLNSTATVVWGCFDGALSLDELAEELAAAYGTSVQQLASDILTLTRQFGRKGLLVGVEREDGAPELPMFVEDDEAGNCTE
jgi:coenzyme PQQ synthesis protein D (PqqD)